MFVFNKPRGARVNKKFFLEKTETSEPSLQRVESPHTLCRPGPQCYKNVCTVHSGNYNYSITSVITLYLRTNCELMLFTIFLDLDSAILSLKG